MHGIIVLVGGFLLDCLLGDPHNPWHPICLIGYLISFLEKKIRKLFPKQPKGEFYGGLVMVILVLFISTAVPIVLLKAAKWIHPHLALVLEIIMCYQLLAARSLRDESMKVYHALHQHDIEGARKAVSMIVGRDTQRLDAAGIAKAAVETVAENASDGVIAPMIFIAIGGVPLVMPKGHGTSFAVTGIIMPARILRRQRRLVPGHLAFSWRETHGILASAIINRRLEMR